MSEQDKAVARNLIDINTRQIAANLKMAEQIATLTFQRDALLAVCQQIARANDTARHPDQLGELIDDIMPEVYAAIALCPKETR
jgi:hypothetical protein